MVLVRCHNKSYNVAPAPMADVDAVVGMVARLALADHDLARFDSSAAQLLVSDKGKGSGSRAYKELERGVPWRFLNVPSGASLTLITGLERVLGADGATAKSVDFAATSAAQPVGVRMPQPPASHPSAAAAAPAPSRAVATATTPAPSSPMVAEMTADAIFLFDPRSLEASGAWDDAVDYELTQRDAMIMQSSLAKNTQTLNSGRLMTQKMRDEERRRKIASLSKARIRIEFEGALVDNLVVQFHVPAAASLEELHDIVRLKVLKSELIKYKLIDPMPPRRQVPRVATSVYEAGMWPATRLVVSMELDGVNALDAPGDVFTESLVQRQGVLPPHRGNAELPSQKPASVAPAPNAKRSAASQAGGSSVPKWFPVKKYSA